MSAFRGSAVALSLLLSCHCVAQPRPRESPIWALGAVVLHPPCGDRGGQGQRIESPDNHILAEVRCHGVTSDGDPTFDIEVSLPGGQQEELKLDEGAHELLWSPDSKAFFIDGGDSSYAGFFVSVYRIDQGPVRKVTIPQTAQRDMVRSFPPCEAYNRDPKICKQVAANPEYNMSGVSWVRGSAAVIVMAEVPCSSYYGGIMCQVQGYELDAFDGRILRKMTAPELKKEWQSKMAWDMRIPDPPAYGLPCQTFKCQ